MRLISAATSPPRAGRYDQHTSHPAPRRKVPAEPGNLHPGPRALTGGEDTYVTDGPGDFTEFVKLRSDRLLHFAFWMTGNWEEAKDVVQESLARAYFAWARIEQPDAYLHRLVVNSARTAYRAR